MGQEKHFRGKAFESRVGALLNKVAARHPGFIEVVAQPEIVLLNSQMKRPDFELIYRLDQEHHELIECQSRDRSSPEIAEKIRQIKSLSSRNRFLFVFEDISSLSGEHRKVLEGDGVNCLSPEDLEAKLRQLDSVVGLLKGALSPDVLTTLRNHPKKSDLWVSAIRALLNQETGETRRRRIYDDSSEVMRSDDWSPYRGPS